MALKTSAESPDIWTPLALTPSHSDAYSSVQTRPSGSSGVTNVAYRDWNLRRANIFVDSEIPAEVTAYIDKYIFTRNTMRSNFVHGTRDQTETRAREVAKKFASKSRNLAGLPGTSQTEWITALHTALSDMIVDGLRIVLNQDWNGDLKPPTEPLHSTDSPHPRKRGRIEHIRARPEPRLDDPHPTMSVGIIASPEKTMDRSQATSSLMYLQDAATLVSDPHVTSQYCVFPFLTVETTVAGTGGNLYQAQNRAAVNGAIALNLLVSASDYATELGRPIPRDMRSVVFSVTSEGPVHELWLHWPQTSQNKRCMACIGTWRTTLENHALDFMRHLSAVMMWGNDKIRTRILDIFRITLEG